MSSRVSRRETTQSALTAVETTLPGRDRIFGLREMSPVILPSLLQCDFANLQREVERLVEAGVTALHLDVMDGQFVPNLTYGMPIVRALRNICDLPLDVHLMIEGPERYLKDFRAAGADSITVHIEAVRDPATTLQEIRGLGAAAGIALNPQTPVDTLAPCVGYCDLVLVMSVQAGFGGQAFDASVLSKLSQVRQMFGSDVICEMDGGINRQTIGRCAAAGAELLVVGSAIFGQADYGRAVAELHREATMS